MDLLKSYLVSNKRSLLTYIGICLFFNTLNFIFFRDNIDAPVDLIFTVVYISIAPSPVAFLILLNSDILTANNRTPLMLINLLVPFLISFVFAMIYWIIEMQEYATLAEISLINGFSFPLVFLSTIVILLVKCYSFSISKLLLLGVVVFLVYSFTLEGIYVFEKQLEYSIYTIIGNILFFFVIPFGYMMFLIRRLDTISD